MGRPTRLSLWDSTAMTRGEEVTDELSMHRDTLWCVTISPIMTLNFQQEMCRCSRARNGPQHDNSHTVWHCKSSTDSKNTRCAITIGIAAFKYPKRSTKKWSSDSQEINRRGVSDKNAYGPLLYHQLHGLKKNEHIIVTCKTFLFLVNFKPAEMQLLGIAHISVCIDRAKVFARAR